ncbi:unnamed protein product [Brachionus calyciflorus]|uniref:Uncharacterized protein n=1 Tax=Brachionus calyciflorus TaxID=104777 RepID=A0A813UBD5_9BILA|nr:unnamed protein product [Brachionus calyciflorus]
MSNPTTTKKITIDTNDNKKGFNKDPQVIVKAFRIALTFFYGIFFANAIFDNLIGGIPYVIEDATAFPIIKITIGALIIILTIVAMIGIWRKIWPLIFASAIALIILSIFALIVSIIDLVQRKERKALNSQDFASDIIEIVVEFIFRIIAIVIKFLMIKLIRGYQRVPTSA